MDGNGGLGAQDLRVGHGYDLHRLDRLAPHGAGRALIVGGVLFEHEFGPVGHSDSDVLLHAITDALLGALALPDIGQLFPDTDGAHEGQESSVFLAEAARLVRERGFVVVNVDATVVLERPKLGERKGEMREKIAGVLGVDVSRVNVKGKTGEGVGAVGEGRAIEAHVVVLLGRLVGA